MVSKSKWLILGLTTIMTSCVNYQGIGHFQTIRSSFSIETKYSLPQNNGLWPKSDWYKNLGDAQLSQIIAEGLAQNPDLKILKARVNQATAITDAKYSQLYPKISTYFSAGEQRLSASAFPPPLGGAWQSIGASLINVTYDLDLWQKNSSLYYQAFSYQKAEEILAQQARLTLITTMATLYNQLSYQYQLAGVLKKTVRQRQQLVKVSRLRLKSGLDTNVQLYQALNLKAQAEVSLIETLGNIKLIKQQLGLLSGVGPDRGLKLTRPKINLLSAAKLPYNLPIDLLGRRPDLVAARWQVEAAFQGVKATKAEFYPNINLLASVGYLSFGLDRLFTKSSENIILAPALRLPIFDAGFLRSQLRNRYALLDKAIADYNKILLKSLGEIAEQLSLIKTLDNQLIAEKQGLATIKRATFLANQRYQSGLTSQLTVIEAETQYLIQQKQYLQLINQRAMAQIALIKALGGGFSSFSKPQGNGDESN